MKHHPFFSKVLRLAIMILLGGTLSGEAANSGIVAWFGGDNSAQDSVGGHPGTLQNEAAFAPGKVGYGFSLNGGTEENFFFDASYVEVADRADLSITGDLTIEAWIKPSVIAGRGRGIVAKKGASNGGYTYHLYVTAEGALVFYARQADGSFQTIQSADGAVAAGVFTHVAATVGGGTWNLYINGTSVVSRAETFVRPATDGPLVIGETFSRGYFAGVIDELTICNRALTGAELAAIVAAGSAGKPSDEVAREFSATANPGGPWKYGVPFVAEGGLVSAHRLTLFTEQATDGPLQLWRTPDATYPHAGRNSSDEAYFPWAPGEFSLHPGAGEKYAAVAWTAPATGTYVMAATFRQMTPTENGVLINAYWSRYESDGSGESTEIFTTQTLNTTTPAYSFTEERVMAAGELYIFTVGANGDETSDSTALAISVTPINSTPPTPQPLPPTTLAINGDVADRQPISFTASNAATENVAVRLQFTDNPDPTKGWEDLDDGDAGAMASAGNGTFTLATGDYPSGTNIRFRAIAAREGVADSISNVLGPYTLRAPKLEIALTATSTSDPAAGSIVRIGDELVYTLTVANGGPATARNLEVRTLIPRYIAAANNLQKQFDAADLVISAGGQIFTSSTLVNGVAQLGIRWPIGDLASGLQQFVRYTVRVTNKVQSPSSITQQNDYEVSSLTGEPAPVATRESSGSKSLSAVVRGPVKITAKTSANTVAPGGFITYTFTLENLSAAKQDAGAIVVEIPPFTRFVGYGFDKKGKLLVKPPSGSTARLISSGTGKQLLVSHGAFKAFEKVDLMLTVQVMWISPSAVPGQKIPTVSYAGAFLKKDAAKIFKALILKGVASGNYGAFLADTGNHISYTAEDSGILNVTLAGSLNGQPVLQLLSLLGDDPDRPLDGLQVEDQGNGEALHTVEPGREMTFNLVARNGGENPAEEVYVQARLPAGTQLVIPRNKPVSDAISFQVATASSKASDKTLIATLGDNGQTLLITGLRLLPKDAIFLTYTVLFPDGGSGAPVPGQVFTPGATVIGSASTPKTPEGFPGYVGIRVVEKANLIVDDPRLLVQPRSVSVKVEDTAKVLDAIFKQDAAAFPYVDLAPQPVPQPAPDPAPKRFVPGFQRYYVDYHNEGGDASPATFTWQVPTDCVFYRGAVVGVDGTFADAKGKPDKLPAGITTTPPAPLSEGTAWKVTFAKLKKGARGTLMLEVIAKKASLDHEQPSVVEFKPTLVSGTGLQTLAVRGISPKAGTIDPAVGVTKPMEDPSVPKIGMVKVTPNSIPLGGAFSVQVGVVNYGDVAAQVSVQMKIPPGCTWVSTDAGESTTVGPLENSPGNTVTANLEPNNGPFTRDSASMKPHTSAAVTFHFIAHTGVFILDESLVCSVGDASRFYYNMFGDATYTAISPLTPRPGFSRQVVNAPDIAIPNSGTAVIPLGVTGKNLTSAPAYVVDLTTGNAILANSDGNVIVTGSDALTKITGRGKVGKVAVAQLTSASGVKPALAAGVDYAHGKGGGLIGQDGAGLIGNDGTGVIGQDGGGLIGQDGGGLIGQDGGGLIANDGGTLIANDGGTLIANDGGTLAGNIGPSSLVGAGVMEKSAVAKAAAPATSERRGYVLTYGGGVIASTSAHSVGPKGATVAISHPSSTAAVVSLDGNVVIAGGGRLLKPGEE